MRKTTFKGANVFMSRNLVPPELFASLHDVLMDNGADIVLCCNPSRNGPNDYHIISSRDHEKFDDLRQKGCNLLGPQCVFSCAKEHRALPKQGFTCCLAMDGVKILASGFEMKEKVEIGKLVSAMGGVLHNKASSDVSFVIVKNVLAAKYKWALNTLKKPIVSESWLQQCWKEHRVVPHESYRVLPFSGLTISVTQVPLDERKEIEKLVQQNGGKYTAELTRKCTHLVCDAPKGDKFDVAKKWGHTHIVTRTWLNQSVAKRACLNEESYQVTSTTSEKTSLKMQRSQETMKNSQCAPVSTTNQVISNDADLEATLSQNMASSTFSDVPVFINDENRSPIKQPTSSSMNVDGCIAEDSQSEDNDLYLMNCMIHLVGFDASEMRRLVNMVRNGGGSRFMSLNEHLTHIVVGTPSEAEKKEVRSLSAMGVINVVRTLWLEDCDREKKEIPVLRRHVAYDLLLPKDSVSFNKGSVSAMPSLKQGNPSISQQILKNDQQILKNEQSQSLNKGKQKEQHGMLNESQNDNKSGVFKGRSFRFSTSFPVAQRGEIVDWIHEGGGEVVDPHNTKKHVNYIVELHGVINQFSGVTNVSSHWIRSCLQDGHLLDLSSHVIFSPLQCTVPLPGFTGLNFCVSQYEVKDIELLRNLCHILGGRLHKILTKKVNYLICKFTEGPKYEAACRWGVQTITIEWIWECIKQNKIVACSQFMPKEATMSEREAGICSMSQFPTQSVGMIPTAGACQSTKSQLYDPKTLDFHVKDISSIRKESKKSSVISNKKPKLTENGKLRGSLSSTSSHQDSVSTVIDNENKVMETNVENSKLVPDVAAAIEDLLEQTSKIQDQKSPERTPTDKNVAEVFTSDINSEDPHSAFGLSKHWIRSNEKDEITHHGREENVGIYGGFSETQTESQVVSYEEDLSGRQKIIDRVRTRSGLTPNTSLT